MVGAEEDRQQLLDGRFGAGFVEAHAELAAAQHTQIDARRHGALDDRSLRTADLERQGVEEVLVEPHDALALQPGGQQAGQPVHALGDTLEPSGPW